MPNLPFGNISEILELSFRLGVICPVFPMCARTRTHKWTCSLNVDRCPRRRKILSFFLSFFHLISHFLNSNHFSFPIRSLLILIPISTTFSQACSHFDHLSSSIPSSHHSPHFNQLCSSFDRISSSILFSPHSLHFNQPYFHFDLVLYPLILLCRY